MKGVSKKTVLTVGAILLAVAVLYALQKNAGNIDGFQVLNSINSSFNLFGVDVSGYSWWQKILYYLGVILFFIFCLILLLFIVFAAGGQGL